jgi:hypothetical protein
MAVPWDDDDASKVLLSELLQSSPVPAFNPLHADPLPANQYLTPQLLQLLLTTSKLQLLRHLRLCSIGSPLTRYSMCLSAKAIVHARSRRVSTRVRCSSLRLVVTLKSETRGQVCDSWLSCLRSLPSSLTCCHGA